MATDTQQMCPSNFDFCKCRCLPGFPCTHCVLDKTKANTIPTVENGRTNMKRHMSMRALVNALQAKIEALTFVTGDRAQLPAESYKEACLHPALHTLASHTHGASGPKRRCKSAKLQRGPQSQGLASMLSATDILGRRMGCK